MKKKIVFFDMDNVLVDFESALDADRIKEQVPKYVSVVNGVKKTNYNDIPDIFSYSKPVKGAVEALKTLSQKFAEDSDSKLGDIRNAQQGQFSIEDRDANTPYIKKVRVVNTVEYSLE